MKSSQFDTLVKATTIMFLSAALVGCGKGFQANSLSSTQSSANVTPTMQGAITSISSSGMISGWVVNGQAPSAAVTLNVLIDGVTLNTISAGTQNASNQWTFQFQIPQTYDDGQNHSISIVPTTSGSSNFTALTNMVSPMFNIAAPLSCSFNGQTVGSGSTAAGYTTATVPFGTTCTSEPVTCTNGVLSPTNAFATCTVSPAAGCNFNGLAVTSGASVTAYETNTVPAGQTCVAQSRVCTNGVLSGIYTFSTCSVSAPLASCSFGGQTLASGSSVEGYTASTVPFGGSCTTIEEKVTCTNGVLAPANAFTSCSALPFCTPNSEAACSSGNGTGFYTCNAQGTAYGACVLNACGKGYTLSSDTCVANPTVSSFTASPTTVVRGSSTTLSWVVAGDTFAEVCPTPSSCVAVTGTSSLKVTPTPTTSGGTTATYTLSLSNAIGIGATASVTINITPAPPPPLASCTFDSKTIASGSTVTAYETATAPFGTTCVSQSRVCTNGTLSGTYTFASCSVAAATAPVIKSFAPTVLKINSGTSATLAWTVTGTVTSLSVSGVGAVAVTATSVTVTPSNVPGTYSYTLTATGPGGTATATTAVTVAPYVITGITAKNPYFANDVLKVFAGVIYGAFVMDEGALGAVRQIEISKDNGATFQAYTVATDISQISDIAVTTTKIFVATDLGIYASALSPVSFSLLPVTVTGGFGNGGTTLQAFGDYVYIGEPSAIYISRNGGASFTKYTSPAVSGAPGDLTFWYADANYLYIENCYNYFSATVATTCTLLHSNNGGETFTPIYTIANMSTGVVPLLIGATNIGSVVYISGAVAGSTAVGAPYTKTELYVVNETTGTVTANTYTTNDPFGINAVGSAIYWQQNLSEVYPYPVDPNYLFTFSNPGTASSASFTITNGSLFYSDTTGYYEGVVNLTDPTKFTFKTGATLTGAAKISYFSLTPD